MVNNLNFESQKTKKKKLLLVPSHNHALKTALDVVVARVNVAIGGVQGRGRGAFAAGARFGLGEVDDLLFVLAIHFWN